MKMETDRRHRKPKEQITDVMHVSDTVYPILVRVPSLMCLSILILCPSVSASVKWGQGEYLLVG